MRYITDYGFEPFLRVPEQNLGTPRGVAMQWLIDHADEVAIKKAAKGRSIYKAYFDEGVFQGGTILTWRHPDLTPLYVLVDCKRKAGRQGFAFGALEDSALRAMQENQNEPR